MPLGLPPYGGGLIVQTLFRCRPPLLVPQRGLSRAALAGSSSGVRQINDQGSLHCTCYPNISAVTYLT